MGLKFFNGGYNILNDNLTASFDLTDAKLKSLMLTYQKGGKKLISKVLL